MLKWARENGAPEREEYYTHNVDFEEYTHDVDFESDEDDVVE